VSFRFRYAKSWIDSRLMSSVIFYTQITSWGFVSLLHGLAINIIFLQIIDLYILYLKRVTSCVIVHAQTNKCTIAKLFSYTVLFITPTCFGHSCDHIRGVPQQKSHKIHNKIFQDSVKYAFYVIFIVLQGFILWNTAGVRRFCLRKFCVYLLFTALCYYN
jgi:hypothetical protein